MSNHYDMDAPSFKYTKQPQKEKRMFDIITPAGNHVIKSVQYDAPKSLTRLTLACGIVVWVPMLETQLYKPKAGDYYVVTKTGSVAFFDKAVFEGVTKRAASMLFGVGDLFGMRIANPLSVVKLFEYRFDAPSVENEPKTSGSVGTLAGVAGNTLTDLGEITKESFNILASRLGTGTLSMREENGYVDKAQNAFTTPAEAAKDLASKISADEAPVIATTKPDINHLLSTMDAKMWADEFVKLNTASDHGTMLTWFACAIMTGFDEAHRRRDAADAERGDKDRNTIKSLTAQNANKQTQISDLRKRCDKQADTIREYQQAVEALRSQITVQATNGNWDYDEYMRGMLNGMLCAMSNFDGKDPQYKEELPSWRKEATRSMTFSRIKQVAGHVLNDGVVVEITNALADAKLI